MRFGPSGSTAGVRCTLAIGILGLAFSSLAIAQSGSSAPDLDEIQRKIDQAVADKAAKDKKAAADKINTADKAPHSEPVTAPAPRQPPRQKPQTLSGSLPPTQGFPVSSGQGFRDCSDCPEMIIVPAGAETRKSDFQEPKTYRLAKSLAISKYPITRAEFSLFAAEVEVDRTWRQPGIEQGDNHPVVKTSWNDAMQYAGWLSRKTNKPYRLLSADEWDYLVYAAHRDSLPSVIQLKGPSEIPKGTFPVGGSGAEGLGLPDLFGNVEIWLSDCIPAQSTPEKNPCRIRAVGSSGWDAALIQNFTSREGRLADVRSYDRGIRVVRDSTT